MNNDTQPGCGECCHSVPVIPDEEVQPILDRLREKHGREFSFDEVFRRTPDGRIFTKTNDTLIEPTRDLPQGSIVVRRCKLFTEDGRCDVYGVHPKICKEYDCPNCPPPSWPT